MIQKIRQDKIFLMFLIFVLGMSAFAFVRTINVNDFYWHVKTGEWIAVNGRVPTNGIYSWYAANIHWTAHEWLFALFIYYVQKVGGDFGVFLYSVLTASTLMFLLYWNIRKGVHKNPVIAFIWLCLSLMSVFMIVSARPHMLMFILTTLLMMLLYHFKKNPSTKLIWLLPVIALFWANIHGGSSNLVYALPVMMLATSFKSGKFLAVELTALPRNRWKLLAGLTVASILMIMVNPNGYHMLVYPYSNMGDSLMLSFILEWRSPDAKNTNDLIIAFAPLVFHVIMLAIKNKRIRGEDILYILFFAFMTMRSIRFAYYIYMIQSLTLFDHIEFQFLKEHKKKFAAFAMMLGLLFASYGGMTFDSKILAEKSMSDEILAAVKEEKPERILNHYNYGGYLIYHDIPVFVDGRADMYSKYNIENYLAFDNFKLPDIEKYFNDYKFDYLLIQKSDAVYNYLKNTDYLDIIAEDDESVFYKLNYKKMNEKD